VDAAEDEEFGPDSDGWELPEELRRRESRLARIRQVKAELEAEARKARAVRLRELAENNAEKARTHPKQKVRRAAATNATKQRAQAEELDPSDADDDDPPDDAPTLPFHRPPAKPDGSPKPKAQRNFTDPDSRIMVEGSGAFAQAYNAQVAVTEGTQIMVACPVSNQPPDTEYLQPTLAEVKRTTGRLPERITADAGYWSAENAAWCEANDVDAYIATGRIRHGPAPPGASGAAPNPKRQMAAKLRTDEGHEMYRRRKYTAEPPFGQIKGARGFRQFSFRGLVEVRLEWSLVCLTHNLLKLFRATGGATLAPAST